MSALDRALTIEDLKRIARRRVPRQFFDYIDSGAYTEGTYRANEDDFRKITFRHLADANSSRCTRHRWLIVPLKQYDLLVILKPARRQQVLKPGLDGNRCDFCAAGTCNFLSGSRP